MIDELRDQLTSLRDSKRNADEELINWKDNNTSSIIDGEWEVTIEKTRTNEKDSYFLNISSTHAQITSPNTYAKEGFIKMFYKNPHNNGIQMLIKWADKSDIGFVNTYYYLNTFDDMKLLDGNVDDTSKIRFKKR